MTDLVRLLQTMPRKVESVAADSVDSTSVTIVQISFDRWKILVVATRHNAYLMSLGQHAFHDFRKKCLHSSDMRWKVLE